MPFTPFHFGPGVLAKALAPRYFSLSAFVATQIVIDVESLFFLLRSEWPVHRVMHTLVVGSMIGIAVGFTVYALGRTFDFATPTQRPIGLLAEATLVGAVVGGFLGGLSHGLLDGLMHTDIRPLRPLADTNPFLGLVTLGVLHTGCLVAGIVGVLWLAARPGLWRATP